MRSNLETSRAKSPKLSRQFVRDRAWVSEHLQELIANYPNQWVLIHKGEVIADGDKAWSLWRNANELGLGQPYIRFIEREMHVYKAYLAEDNFVPPLLGVEDVLTNAHLVGDYPLNKTFLHIG